MNTVQSTGGGHGVGKKNTQEEELVVSTPSQRNWRGILIALLVIIAVLGLIVFGIVLVSPPEEGHRVKGRRPDLEEVLDDAYVPRAFNGTWISESEFVYRDMNGGISVYNADNLTTRVLMTNTIFRQENTVDFKVSSDLKYVLLISDVKHVYRYTTLSKYHVIEIATRTSFPLSPKEDDTSAPYLQYATWSPNGVAIAFVHENDVYYKPRVNVSLICRITSTGKPGAVFNGIPDWLYENEILHTGHSLWFSNDGKFLMYVTYNDSLVGEYRYPWYERGDANSRYPKVRSVRYPKTGTDNPVVTVSVVNLKRTKYLFPTLVRPTNSVDTDSYVTHVSWYSNHQVAVVWLNRRQNVSVIATCKSPNFTCTNLHIEKAERDWTEPIIYPIFSQHGGQCLARLPVQDGDKGHYMHVCQIQTDVVQPITHGTFEVTRILAWDEDNHVIYVIASGENDPAHRHLYKVGDGNATHYNTTHPWTCLTCTADDVNQTSITNLRPLNISQRYRCNYNRISFSHSYRYYVQECLGPDVTVTYLVETANNSKLAILDGHRELKKRVSSMAAPQIKRFGELVVSTPSQRNWRGILIALLVIIAVLGLIVFGIVLVSPPEEGHRVKGRRPDLEEVLDDAYVPRAFNGTWISESEFVYRDMNGGISVYNADNLTTRVLMTNTIFRQENTVDFKVSSDLKYVLLISDVKHVYRYTTLSKYHVIEIATRTSFPLSPKEDDTSAPYLQYATWSPNGVAIAFVHENDVYYKPRVNVSLICRITSTGKPGAVFNGIPDWLYENEILHTGHSLWFSNDGKFLMYVTYNDSLVGEYRYPWYERGDANSRYPKVRSVRYPKTGTDNPVVTVSVVNLKRTKYLFPTLVRPTNSVDTDSYVTHVSWYSNHQVAVVWLNRRQNVSVIATCKSPNFTCTNLHIEKAERDWTEPIIYPIFSQHGGQCLARLPVQDGDKGHYMHVCQIQTDVVQPITHGTFEVTRILAWDEDNHVIYVIASGENDPAHRHLYKVGDGNATHYNTTHPWTCLTCTADDVNQTSITNLRPLNISQRYRCNYNRISFSHSYRYYVQECLGPDVTVTYLVETANNSKLAILDGHRELKKRVSSMAAPQIKRFGIEIDDKYRAQVRLFYPPGLREYEEITFPLILLVLGTVEVLDQLTVLKYLLDTFKFMDRTKVCAVGVGYGGYVTAMMLTKDSHKIINCSVSISPISNWQFYHSYFTERYMGLPNENPLSYDQADLTKAAGNLVGRDYLLVHGTADTMVKPQHAMLLARALVDQKVLFRQLVYPDEDHTIKITKPHLYRQIDQFFDDSFGPITFDDWESEGGFFIQ